jgi:hypothetical protein
LGSRRQALDGWEAVTPWLKTEASVSCPTEALFFAAAPPEPLQLPKISQALAAESSATADSFQGQFQRVICRCSLPEIRAEWRDGSWAKRDWVAASRPACVTTRGTVSAFTRLAVGEGIVV